MNEKLQSATEKILSNYNIPIFGFSNLEGIRFNLREKHNDFFKDFTSAISLGLPLLKTMLRGLKHQDDYGLINAFENNALTHVNSLLEYAAYDVARVLESKGYKAFVEPARDRFYDEPPLVMISHKMIANLAGLGWIGKSSILINPDFGPAFRLISIITDAPLASSKTNTPLKNICNTCNECVKHCPSNAINGEEFDWDNPYKEMVDSQKCEKYRTQRSETIKSRMCNLCMYHCPVPVKLKN